MKRWSALLCGFALLWLTATAQAVMPETAVQGLTGWRVCAVDEDTRSGHPGDYAALLLQGERDEGARLLVVAERVGEEYRIAAQSMRVCCGDYAEPSEIRVRGRELALTYDSTDMELIFDEVFSEWTLRHAKLSGGAALERDEIWGYTLTEATGETAQWMTLPMRMPRPESVSDSAAVDVSLLPQSVEQVRALNSVSLPIWSNEAVYLDAPGDKTLPVYAAPGKNAYRGAKGKAAVSLKDAIWVLDWLEDNALMIFYRTGETAGRVGYVYADRQIVEALKAKGWTREKYVSEIKRWGRIPLCLTADAALTDDPFGTRRTLALLPAGTEIVALCCWDGLNAYVETQVDGRTARGFVPMTALSAPKISSDAWATERLTDTVWMSSEDGLAPEETIAFRADGVCERVLFHGDGQEEQAALRWQVAAYELEWGLFWNDPPYMLALTNTDGYTEYWGICIEEQWLALSDGEGIRGYALLESGWTPPKVVRPMPDQISIEHLPDELIMAHIEDVREDSREITVTLWEEETFSAQDVAQLEPGNILLSQGWAYKVDALFGDENVCFVQEDSEDWYLVKRDDGNYDAMNMHDHVWHCVGMDTFSLAENAEFWDGIDPGTGCAPDEPIIHGMDEWIQMWKTEETLGFTGFSCNNTWITVDRERRITRIERRYVPWQ